MELDMKLTLIAVAVGLSLSAGVSFADTALAQKNGCLTCHKLEGKLVGPGYKDVAKHYKGDAKAEAHLTEVIKNGSKGGVFGPVPMTKPVKPVSDADAAALAKWILSL
jgi:cytochrome c